MRAFANRQRLVVLVALAALATGCGKFREVSACRSIAREVNAAMDEIEPLSKARPMDDVRIAQRYAALAKALEPRTRGESPLAVAMRDYVAVLQGTDVALRSHAQALKSQYGRVNDPRRELERLVKREHAAAARIDVECEH